MTEVQPRECPDSGRCHHDCTVGCFRVEYASPLSIAKFPDDKWPEDVVKEFALSDGHL